MVDTSTQTMVEMSTQTEEEEGSAVFSEFMSTQIEDLQETSMVAQSYGMIAPATAFRLDRFQMIS